LLKYVVGRCLMGGVLLKIFSNIYFLAFVFWLHGVVNSKIYHEVAWYWKKWLLFTKQSFRLMNSLFFSLHFNLQQRIFCCNTVSGNKPVCINIFLVYNKNSTGGSFCYHYSMSVACLRSSMQRILAIFCELAKKFL